MDSAELYYFLFILLREIIIGISQWGKVTNSTYWTGGKVEFKMDFELELMAN
jgi:hypothetical protein